MNSRIYVGTITHERFRPVSHRLSYPLYFYGLDLDELPHIGRKFPLFGYNKKNISAIHDRDYLTPGQEAIHTKLERLMPAMGNRPAISFVTTITGARYLNYVFNPVSFHYCFDGDRSLIGIVAEVNNTFGERHHYLLTDPLPCEGNWLACYKAPKAFHVSPFNRVEGTYLFYFSHPGPAIHVRIVLVCDEKVQMSAELKGTGSPMTPAAHLKTILKYPLVPHMNIPRIYAQAFKLFFKRKLTYHDKPEPSSRMTIGRQEPTIAESICRRLVISAFRKIVTGRLIIEEPSGTKILCGPGAGGPIAGIRIISPAFFTRVVLDGEIGFGEAFTDGLWDTPDLVNLTRLLILNRDCFSDGNMVTSFLTRIREKIAHEKRKNTVENARKNISDHYDLSNAFYELFLDRRMIYSCGIFNSPENTLETAQENKMRRMLDKAGVGAGHHLLEIGCGWGGFAVFAVKETGCRVTGITISRAQYERACQRVKDEGLEDRITILLKDYRHIQGQFDRIISIEMIEAVGPQFLGTFFRRCRELLTPNGVMVFQTITIADDRYDRYLRERDWIQKHIFPGGHLPCLKSLDDAILGHTDFEITGTEHIGQHYATTLEAWRDRFLQALPAVRSMGFTPGFIRKWIYYLSVCEAGFDTGAIDDIQMVLTPK
ncbi:MAG: DUF1365 family protein [Desulfobacteraceae bacterium]|nr:MAG: DUF1365 family protein [Desulfobacteraceae bacterium]